MNLDKRIKALVERIDAEEVSVTLIYDKDSWWDRQGKGRPHKFEAVIEWEDDNEKYVIDGDVRGLSFRSVFDSIEAEINGVLLRRQLHRDKDE